MAGEPHHLSTPARPSVTRKPAVPSRKSQKAIRQSPSNRAAQAAWKVRRGTGGAGTGTLGRTPDPAGSTGRESPAR